ncbi:MAG: hypothetical protein ABL986_18935 [Vicinamibacterales bacterium]
MGRARSPRRTDGAAAGAGLAPIESVARCAACRSRDGTGMTNGQKVFVAYFAAFVFMPAVAQGVFGPNLAGIYWVVPANLNAVLTALFVFVSTLIGARVYQPRPSVGPPGLLRRAIVRAVEFYDRHRLPLSVLALVLSLAYLSAGFLSFRYMTVGISDQNSVLLLVGNILSTLILIDLTFRIFREPEPVILRKKQIENLIFALSFMALTNGTASSVIALAFLGFALIPSFFQRALFVEKGRSAFRQGAKTLAAIGIAASLFLAAWVSGEAIKTSSSGNKDLVSSISDVVEETRSDTAANYFYYLVSSLSTHYYAHTFMASTPREQILQEAPWPLALPFETLFFRAGYLVGAESRRPEIGAFSRLNYVLLTAERVTERQGTSPGLLAAFEYAFGFPFGPLTAAIYAVWICSLFDRLVAPGRRLSFAGALLLLGMLLFVFQSPFDMLSIFDNTTLTFAGVLGIAVLTPRHAPQTTQEARPARPGVVARPRSSRPILRAEHRSWRSV